MSQEPQVRRSRNRAWSRWAEVEQGGAELRLLVEFRNRQEAVRAGCLDPWDLMEWLGGLPLPQWYQLWNAIQEQEARLGCVGVSV